MRRTQIYLDEDQKKALKLIAAESDSTVSDIVREAIDRVIKERIDRGQWAARLGEWQERLRERYGDFTEEQVDAALRSVRTTGKKQ
jgi:Arc/MetJ-type ribon-helix-helix transcriptional regulator